MGGMDQDGLRFEGNCTLKLPKTSTHCTGCFATIAAFRDKVCCTIECKVSHCTLHSQLGSDLLSEASMQRTIWVCTV